MEYRVQLDVFNGPLDLLLYLIKRDELDIYDIPIAQITDSYMHYVNMLRDLKTREGIDINVAGDFLVMAATLMEVKSALLLPKPPVQETDPDSATAELTDPRYELVKQLLDYKRFRDTASRLETMAETHANRFPRHPVLRDEKSDEPPPLDLEEVQVWDLLEAFGRLMKEVGRRANIHEVVVDDTPQALHAADIADRLARESRLGLRTLLLGRRNRAEMIGVFLALLEMIRQRKVAAEHNVEEDEFYLMPVAESDDEENSESADTEPSEEPPPLHIAEKSLD